MTLDPAGTFSSAARLEQFRARTPRQKLHPTEETLLWIIALQVCFLPWALGGRGEWAQWTSLALSVAAFGVALLPREYVDVAPGQAPFRLLTWSKLIRFPVFWLGLALLGYIAIQGLNPAWTFEPIQTTGFKMHRAPYKEWLPSGVSVPFSWYGPWRMLVIYASVFLTVCATWIGFTRRRSLQVLFTVIAANAFILAILGIAQRATGATKIFWYWTPPAGYFVSSFTYKNHAGAYFNLMLALCTGLALWHYERGLRRLDKSSPSGLFGFFATAALLMIVFSYSRTATILMFVFLVLAVAIFFFRVRRQTDQQSSAPVLPVFIALVLITFVYLGVRSINTERLVTTFNDFQKQVAESGLGMRGTVAQATWEMAQDRPWYGWGCGSYRFIFSLYQQRHPEILRLPDSHRPLYWEHAHNDYVEIFAEFGIVGCALIVAIGGYLIYRYFKAAGWQNAVGIFGAVGCALVAAHSVVDFQAFNVAILTTGCFLFVAVIRWSEIEEVNP